MCVVIVLMMTSWYGNSFPITEPLCGKPPVTGAFLPLSNVVYLMAVTWCIWLMQHYSNRIVSMVAADGLKSVWRQGICNHNVVVGRYEEQPLSNAYNVASVMQTLGKSSRWVKYMNNTNLKLAEHINGVEWYMVNRKIKHPWRLMKYIQANRK